MNHKEKNKIRSASFEDTFVIGINSGIADYKLAWLINNKLALDFTRQEDIFAEGVSFAFYYYTAGENSQVYNLVSIECGDKTLFDFSPRLDFLLVIRNGITLQRANFIVKSLREMEGVGHAFLLDVNKGKSIKQVLEIIELQEIILLENIKKRNNLDYVRQQVMRQRSVSQRTEYQERDSYSNTSIFR